MNQYRGGGGHGRDRRQQRSAAADVRVRDHWRGYLEGGYFDADGHLKVEYVAREKVEPLVQAMCRDGRAPLTTHQVRRFFGHCRAIETKLKSLNVEWGAIWSELHKLDIAAADGLAKDRPKIPVLFADFITRNVAAVKNDKDFLQGFLPHFEALVGFGTAHFEKDRK